MRIGRLALLCLLAALLPIVVASVRAIANDWVATGDNAYFAVRSRDVLTDHHPLLGSWTSASTTTGINMNNPGPLYFDLLALPVKVGADAGLVVGVALINVAAVVGTALVARRVAGPQGVVLAMLAATGLGWAMGSELLFDPWQPHSLMLPFLWFLMLVWALATGDLAMLPWAAGLASFVVQTHVGYAVVVPLLAAWGIGAAGVRLWRARAAEPDRWPATRRRALRYLGLAGVVALVCWSQTVYEQLFGRGPGNLGLLVSGSRVAQPRVGAAEAPRFVAEVLALPPWWGRPSMSDSLLTGVERDALPSRVASIAGLLAVAGLLAGAAAFARRRHDGSATAPVTGLVVMFIALLSVTTMPVGYFDVAPHHLRWLWPVAVFLMFGLALALLGPPTGRRARGGVLALTLVTLALSVASLPSMNPRVGPAADADSMPTIRALAPQLASLSDETGVLFDLTGQRFAEPYMWAVMSELQRLGVPWFVDHAAMVRQVGPERAWPADASVRLFLREGSEAREVPPGIRRVAFVERHLPEDEDAALSALREELTPFITGGGLRLTEQADADAAAAASDDPVVGGVSDTQLRDPDYLFDWGTPATGYQRKLVFLVVADRLDVPERWLSVLERYAELQQRADRLTVGVFAEPLVGTP